MEFRSVCASVMKMTWSKFAGQGRAPMSTQRTSHPNSRQRVILDQFHADFSHEYLMEEYGWGPWARPFVMGSVGVTHVSSSTSFDFTRFSFGLGGGIRFYASRHFGFKIQAEWLPVFAHPQVAFICGSGCIVHVNGTLSSQGEGVVGPLLRF